MRHWVFLILLSVLIGEPATGFAQPGNPQKSLGSFGAWRTYTFRENDQQVCYMVQTISFAKSKTFKRGSSYLMITHRPAENSLDVVSYTSGYNLKPVSSVTVRIDKSTFSLFTEKDTAWARDPQTDHTMMQMMRSAQKISITGIPAKHGVKPITDKLNLTGSAFAYQAINKACGLAPPAAPKAKPASLKKNHV